MNNKNFNGFSFEKKVQIGLTFLALAWVGLLVYFFWKIDISATTNSYQPLYEKGYVICDVEYHTAGCFIESGSYGISVDELSDYKNGKNIVLSLHDRNGYVKMIASNEVVSIEIEGEEELFTHGG